MNFACKIIHVKEFSQRRACSPADHFLGSSFLCFVEPADECREDVGVLWMEVVMWAVEVGGHAGNGIKVVLE